jgi:NAD-dependent aldehyde dehydrogenases
MVANIGHYIGNKPVAGKSGRSGDVTNPATGEVTGKVAFASEAEIDAAVQIAKKAQACLGGDAAAAPPAGHVQPQGPDREAHPTTSRAISRSSTARPSTMPRERSGAGWRWSSSPAASPIT